MAINNNEGQGLVPENGNLVTSNTELTPKNDVPLKWRNLYNFATELSPIIESLNDLLVKYEINNVDDFIRLLVKKNKIVPFIYVPAFTKGDEGEYVSSGSIQITPTA